MQSEVPIARRLLRQMHPADYSILAILILAISTAALAGSGEELRRILFIHLAMLVGYGIFVLALIKWGRLGWTAYLRPFVAMGTIWTLYCTLGWLGMAAMPFRADNFLARVDTWTFAGINPTFFIQRWQTRGRVEFFAFFYGLFIPYINVSLLLGSLGRPALERDQFLTGWVFTYCISYVGYIFLPAQGPGGFLAGAYSMPLHGGYFYRMVLVGVANSGGLRGAFPSLHVASSLYLCLFDLRTNRLRGLTYLPVVVMIYCATIVLRYHYVIDLLFGTLIAFVCVQIGPWVFLRWAQNRRSAGVPAFPGGEGDVLPDIPTAGGCGAAAVLPAN
jgi:PAP2 superfamily